MEMKRITIAVDGPAGAGKSTISKLVAEKLKIEYVDTGAMYRAVTLKVLGSRISPDDDDALRIMLDSTDIDFINGRVYLDGVDVSEEIRMPYISKNVSEVSAKPDVRQKLVELQRNMATTKSIIMDGRDIGTNVIKDASCKIYLTASVEERAERRYKELCGSDDKTSFEDICTDIKNRDTYDMSRKLNPLKMAEDAVLVDTTGKSIEMVVEEILYIVKEKVIAVR